MTPPTGIDLFCAERYDHMHSVVLAAQAALPGHKILFLVFLCFHIHAFLSTQAICKAQRSIKNARSTVDTYLCQPSRRQWFHISNSSRIDAGFRSNYFVIESFSLQCFYWNLVNECINHLRSQDRTNFDKQFAIPAQLFLVDFSTRTECWDWFCDVTSKICC
ncbi:unnamed protein product [Albugo candida]|uniref:Uncharacterized protein n=1 Tax=Albugo candida TaxID=65357 RepID=A0A024GEL6_9STRA|nr:unnamed protein product [Albugo candida]|eukprot:CCI45215.1 unnamed protein product [Albugo candida]